MLKLLSLNTAPIRNIMSLNINFPTPPLDTTLHSFPPLTGIYYLSMQSSPVAKIHFKPMFQSTSSSHLLPSLTL